MMPRDDDRRFGSFVGLLVLLVGLAEAPAAPAATARWERRASMGVPRQEVGVAAIGETLYAVGGFAGSQPSAAVEAYDVRADRWTAVASLPTALHHVMVAAVDGRLYAAGGLGAATASGATDATFAYDPAADTWTPRAAMPRPRGAGAAAVIDGRIYVAGGLRGSTSVRELAVYDPASDAWAELAAMPTARDHLAAGAIGGRLYAVGGREGGTLFAVVEVFDPATGAWSGGRARMPTARGGLGAAALDGLLYAFGGEGNAASPFGTFPHTEAYDPERDAWTRLPDMGIPRHGIGAAAVGGAIYVMGGATREGLGPSGAGEVFFPASGEPTAGEVLAIRRLVAPRRGRLTLRGRLLESASLDPGAAEITVRVGDLDVASLPLGSVVRSGRRRWRLARGRRDDGAAVARLALRRVRRGDLAVRLRIEADALPAAGNDTAVTLVLGGRAFSGSARVRGRGRQS